MKSLASQAGKKPKTVEKLWNKCEKLVKKKYEIGEDSDRFYPLVVGCLKNLLGLHKKEVEEDAEMTTTNMGSYAFAPKVGELQRRQPIVSDPTKVKTEISDKKYSKKVKKIKRALKESNSLEDFDDLISDNLEYYCGKYNSPEEVIDAAFEATYKYLKITDSLLNELK